MIGLDALDTVCKSSLEHFGPGSFNRVGLNIHRIDHSIGSNTFG
jgi:hypothetical protein